MRCICDDYAAVTGLLHPDCPEHGDHRAKDGGVERMNFGIALEKLKRGVRVMRTGWNGKGMYLFLIDNTWTFTDGRNDNYPNLPFIAMKTADNKVVPWLASQTDILAEDWEIVPG